MASSVLGVVSGCALFACGDYKGWDTGNGSVHDDYSGWTYQDADDDGWDDREDCDDNDPDVNPEADEVCDDEIDNDCDELIDAADVEDCPA